MAKGARFYGESEGTKHVGQSALLAHRGADYFYPKGAFLTEREDDDSAGKPIVLGENGRLDYSLLPGIVEYPTDVFDGDFIPSNGKAFTFAVATTASGTTSNDYIEIARIELKGNSLGGWIELKGLVGVIDREDSPCEVEVMFSTNASGVGWVPSIHSRGDLNAYFFYYLESDGGGSGIHYLHIYFKHKSDWRSLNATIRARVSDITDCEITVWQTGDNVGESTPTGTEYKVNSPWGVNKEFRVYSDDLLVYGRILADNNGFYVMSVSDSLSLNWGGAQNILCFEALTSGNPEFIWYGWDSGASAARYGKVYVAADGSTWVKAEEYLRLCALGGYVDIIPNDASYGMIIRKHDSAGAGGSPYANFFVEDAAIDYLNIVLGSVGSVLGLVISADHNIGVGKVPSASYDVDVGGYINALRYYVGANNYYVVSGDYNRFYTQYGYIQLGPINTSYAHIYTDIANGYYFDKNISANRFASRVAIGTSPLTVVSTTKVTNLNADTLDGYHSSSFYRWVWKTSNTTLSLTGSASPSWTNYDFTSITSANCVAVILAWVGTVGANDHQAYIQWRKDGNTNLNAYMACGGAQYDKSGGQVIVEVDPSTEIAEYYYWKHTSASIIVYLVGYIEKS